MQRIATRDRTGLPSVFEVMGHFLRTMIQALDGAASILNALIHFGDLRMQHSRLAR